MIYNFGIIWHNNIIISYNNCWNIRGDIFTIILPIQPMALYQRNASTLKKEERFRDGFKLSDRSKFENINCKLKKFCWCNLLVNDQSKSLKSKSPKCKTMAIFFMRLTFLWETITFFIFVIKTLTLGSNFKLERYKMLVKEKLKFWCLLRSIGTTHAS